jgi:hypothetical protein
VCPVSPARAKGFVVSWQRHLSSFSGLDTLDDRVASKGHVVRPCISTMLQKTVSTMLSRQTLLVVVCKVKVVDGERHAGKTVETEE